MDNKNFKNSYEQYLRKRYILPTNCKIFVKQGYITKDNETPQMMHLTQRERLLQTQFRIYKLIYDEIKDEILKTYSIIDRAKEDVEILEIQNSSYSMNKELLEIEIESIAKSIIDELARSIRKITQKTYDKTYEILTQEWPDILGTKPESSANNLIEDELYGTITSWLKSFKIWVFENINSSFDDSYLEEKSFIQKNILDDFFNDIKETFEKAKDKIESITRNAILNAQTTAQKIAFKVQRVERYQIILSGNPNTCEKCNKMAGENFNIADLEIGETAPPFHPNCGCTMIPKVYEEKNGSTWEQIVIASNVAFELLAHIGPTEKLIPPFYNFVKSTIWNTGNFYLGNIKKLPLAQEMFRLGIYGEGKGMSKKATELIIEAMKNSKKLTNTIFELTKPGENFDTGRFNFGFEKETDEDLYYAVQNVNMRIIGTNLGNDTWKIKVISWDKYDFTTFRNSLAFADLANNLGEAMQRNGMMTEYDTYTEYEYIW